MMGRVQMRIAAQFVPARVCVAIVGALLPAWIVGAQTVTAPVNSVHGLVLVAADERNLYLAASAGERIKLFHREVGGEFDFGRLLRSRALALTVQDHDAIMVYADGSILRYRPRDELETVERILPGGAIPIELTADDRHLYALVDAGVAGQLPRLVGASGDAESDAHGLAIVALDGEWHNLGNIPARVQPKRSGDLGPRIGLAVDRLIVAWVDADDRILVSARASDSGKWSEPTIVARTELRRIWVTRVNSAVAIVAETEDRASAVPARAWRLLGSDAADPSAWRESELVWSDSGAAAAVSRVRAAFGFNQNLGVLASDAAGAASLHFARFGEKPTEESVRISSAFDRVDRITNQVGLFQLIIWLVLVSVIASLFVLRRESMTRDVILPDALAQALAVQRLIGWAIDFLPFTLVAASILRVDWSGSFQVLFEWFVSPSMQNALPARNVLLWWGSSVGSYVLYCTFIEALTGRSLGKFVTGTLLLSEDVAEPRVWQVLVRNLTRLIELLPPFWVFAFLLLLSRNGQRLGDILGRTIVVRRASAGESTDSHESDGDDQEPR